MHRPLPAGDSPALAGYWAGVSEGVLRVPRCGACGQLCWPPRGSCPACGGMDLGWAQVPATATLHSYAAVNRAFHPAFADELPYTLCVAEVMEGVRFLGRLIDTPAGDIRIGMPLEAVFTDVGGATLVYWRPPGATY
jgi:uncharacterized OB-fold protein